mmetsp:Transcript_29133/g.56126  ORF Transcript_29133/g.56126 Transcript_29133/m.56126 type:complete len:233 (-) Transcript_29133:799-1497(-)
MAPPQLARDAPWLDVFQPVEIHLLAAFGHDFHIATPHRIQRRANDLVCVHEPLVRQQRLNHHFRAVAIGLHDRFGLNHGAGVGDLVAVLVRCRERLHHGQTFGSDIGHNPLARLEPVEAAIFFGHHVHRGDHRLVKRVVPIGDGLGDGGLFGVRFAVGSHVRLGVHQIVHWDVAALGHLIVVEVVRAGDFHSARAEVFVWIFIRNDRDQAAMLFRPDRDFTIFSDDWRITLI